MTVLLATKLRFSRMRGAMKHKCIFQNTDKTCRQLVQYVQVDHCQRYESRVISMRFLVILSKSNFIFKMHSPQEIMTCMYSIM